MSRSITRAEARTMINVQAPIPVLAVNSEGKSLADNGSEIDPRQLVPWVESLGPFGSWPTTVDDALAEIDKHDDWWLGDSFRIGRCIVWKQGWGFAAKVGEE
jgi:hypothetical protein